MIDRPLEDFRKPKAISLFRRRTNVGCDTAGANRKLFFFIRFFLTAIFTHRQNFKESRDLVVDDDPFGRLKDLQQTRRW
jgi:hypothetical protein